MALISVIIPTFNRAALIRRALNSVINQTEKDLEIIVVDNNSTDNTQEIIENEFPGVRLLQHPIKGVSSARNRGIMESSREWVAFLDSDDEWHKEKISAQLNVIKCNPCIRLIHTDEIWIRNGKYVNQKKKHKKLGGLIFNHCLPLCCISPSSVVINKGIFKDYGFFNEELEVCEDYDMWLRVTAFEAVHYIPKELTIKYGGHPDQLSKKFWGMDKYRIMALEGLMHNNIIDSDKKTMVLNAILKKIGILIKGAEKRNNQEILETYLPKFVFWSKILESQKSKLN